MSESEAQELEADVVILNTIVLVAKKNLLIQ